MSVLETNILGRRRFLAGTGAVAGVSLVSLAGCSSLGPFSFVEAVRRMLQLSSERAFDRLLATDGFWNDSVSRLNLPDVFGKRGGILASILTSAVFKDRLQHTFNNFAEDAARNAAPAVADAIRTIGFSNAVALIRGEPTAATTYLRGAMSTRLIDVMVPEFGNLMRASSDPIMGQLLAAATGIDIPGVAHDLAAQADDSIWKAIGREEAAIRADPASTHDSLIETAFGIGAKV